MTSKTIPSDFVTRFLFDDLDIRGAFVRLNDVWRKMQSGRDYADVVRDLLGEMTAVTVLIGCNLKQPSRLGFQLKGHGPVQLLVIDCTEELKIRGMAQAVEGVQERASEEGVKVGAQTLFGDGHLSLVLQNESATEPYQSIVPIVGESIAEIFEYYLAQSEQLSARLWLFANGDSAAGLFIQKLPNADEKDADGWARVEYLASTIKAHEMHTLSPEKLLSRLFPEETLRLYPPRPVEYECPENRDKVVSMLRSLGREEVETAIREQEVLIVRDDICNHEYTFDASDLDELFPAEAPPTLH